MRARHGLWPTTGWEMTLLADDVSFFASLQEGNKWEKKWHVYWFGRKEHLGWREGPQQEKRYEALLTYFYQSQERTPGEGLLVWHLWTRRD